jgi:hypothetical protein
MTTGIQIRAAGIVEDPEFCPGHETLACRLMFLHQRKRKSLPIVPQMLFNFLKQFRRFEFKTPCKIK